MARTSSRNYREFARPAHAHRCTFAAWDVGMHYEEHYNAAKRYEEAELLAYTYGGPVYEDAEYLTGAIIGGYKIC